MNTIAGSGRRTKGRKQKEFLFAILHPSPSSGSSLWSFLPVSTAMRAPGQDFSLLQFPITFGPILLFRAQLSALSAWRLLEWNTKPHSGLQKHPKYILSWFSHHWSPWFFAHNLSTIWSSFYVVPANSATLLALCKLLSPPWAVLATMSRHHRRPSEHLTSPILAVLWLQKYAPYFEGTMKERNVTISLLIYIGICWNDNIWIFCVQ